MQGHSCAADPSITSVFMTPIQDMLESSSASSIPSSCIPGVFRSFTNSTSPSAENSTDSEFRASGNTTGASPLSSSVLPEVGTSTAAPGITHWTNQSSFTPSSFATSISTVGTVEGNISTPVGVTTFTPITSVNNGTTGLSDINTTSPLSPTASSSITNSLNTSSIFSMPTISPNSTLQSEVTSIGPHTATSAFIESVNTTGGSSIALSSSMLPESGTSTSVPSITTWNNQSSSTHSSFTTDISSVGTDPSTEGNISTPFGLTTYTPITSINNATSGPSVLNTTSTLSPTASSPITHVAFNTTLLNNSSIIAESTATGSFPVMTSDSTNSHNTSSIFSMTTVSPNSTLQSEVTSIGPHTTTSAFIESVNTTGGSSIAPSSSMLPESGTSTSVPSITAWNNQSSSTHSSFTTDISSVGTDPSTEGNISTPFGLTTYTPITSINNATSGPSVLNTTSTLSPTASSPITHVAFNTTLLNNGSVIAESTTTGSSPFMTTDSTDSHNTSSIFSMPTVSPNSTLQSEVTSIGPHTATSAFIESVNTTDGSSIAPSSSMIPESGTSTSVPSITAWNDQSSSTHSSFTTDISSVGTDPSTEGNISTPFGLTTYTPITSVNNATSGPSVVNTTSILSPTASSPITHVAFNTTLLNNGSVIAESTTTGSSPFMTTDSTDSHNTSSIFSMPTVSPYSTLQSEVTSIGPHTSTSAFIESVNTTGGSSIAPSSSMQPESDTSTSVPSITAWNNQSSSTHSSFTTDISSVGTDPSTEGNISTPFGLTTYTPITSVNNATSGPSVVNTTSTMSPTASSPITHVAFNTTLLNNGSVIAESTTTESSPVMTTDSTNSHNTSSIFSMTTVSPYSTLQSEVTSIGPHTATSAFIESVNTTGGSSIAPSSSMQPESDTSTSVPSITAWNNQSSSTHSSFTTDISSVGTDPSTEGNISTPFGLTTYTPITSVNNATSGPSVVNTTSTLSPTASSPITHVAFNTTLLNNGSVIAESTTTGSSPVMTTDSTNSHNTSSIFSMTTVSPYSTLQSEVTSIGPHTATSAFIESVNTTGGSSIAPSSSMLPKSGTSTSVPSITAWNNQSSSTHSSFTTDISSVGTDPSTEGNISTPFGLTTYTPITSVNNATSGPSVLNTTSTLSPISSSPITHVAFNTTLLNNGSVTGSSSGLTTVSTNSLNTSSTFTFTTSSPNSTYPSGLSSAGTQTPSSVFTASVNSTTESSIATSSSPSTEFVATTVVPSLFLALLFLFQMQRMELLLLILPQPH
uniref:Uncharacterized threonine-rich GPI-anchored glycoprotein PJ4664.02-like n=1 Tax=Geotrypetes seraphini TaxID=260995 RepID=A0A6P8PJB3_GEOSA|nr:uncharacterized threonine-rich GPI-anchored glycoprotein PJ4664.02-like [Geotrypetes seraphini]